VFGNGCSHCGVHCNDYYDPSLSNTYSSISCGSSTCCRGGDCLCAPGPFQSECGFGVQYGDGSGITGAWSTETVNVGGHTTTMNFGIITKVASNFEPFAVDGIIGFALSSLNYDLSKQESPNFIDSLPSGTPRVFSMCFGDNGGSMFIGGVDTVHMQSGTLVYNNAINANGFWSFQVTDITIGSNSVSSSHQIIIDSGSTLWYLPEKVYSDVKSRLISECATSGCDTFQSIINNPNSCGQFTDDELSQFPVIMVTIGSGTPIQVPATSYLKLGLCGENNYRVLALVSDSCGSSDNPCIYGDAFMQTFMWVFDVDNSRIGYAVKKNCDSESGTISDCVNTDPASSGNSVGWLVSLIVVFAVSLNSF